MKNNRRFRLIALLMTVTVWVSCLPFSGIAATAEATNNNRILFGSYPQSRVTDSGLLSALNADSGKWTDRMLYADGTPGVLMQQKDVTLNGERYRGLKLIAYRPKDNQLAAEAQNSAQDDNGYTVGNTYWFRYDPLSWTVCENGILLCDRIIDSGEFDAICDTTAAEPANDYTRSGIRAFLENTFSDDAFDPRQQFVMATKADLESVDGYRDLYNYDNIVESVFLPETHEVSSVSLAAAGTDYAKAMGLAIAANGNSEWWLRSAGYHSYDACHIDQNGATVWYSDNGFGVNTACCGIRPAIRMDLARLSDSSFDLNGNGTADAADIVDLKRNGLLAKSGNRLYDVNEDGADDVRDLVHYKKYLGGMLRSEPKPQSKTVTSTLPQLTYYVTPNGFSGEGTTGWNNLKIAGGAVKAAPNVTGAVLHSGSENDPFVGLDEARAAVRRVDKSQYSAVILELADGIYSEGGLNLTELDSGSASCPVIYRAATGATPVVDGGLKIPAEDFTAVSDTAFAERLPNASAVKCVDLKSYGLTASDWGALHAIGNTSTAAQYDGDYTGNNCELYINNTYQVLARYPNATADGAPRWLKIGTVGAGDYYESYSGTPRYGFAEYKAKRNMTGDTFTWKKKVWSWNTEANYLSSDDFAAMKARLENWQDPTNVWVYGYPAWNWADAASPLTSIMTSKDEITFKTRFASYYEPHIGEPFYFYNIPEELDCAGEWYLDRDTGMLYVYAENGLGNAEITLTLSDDSLICATGTDYVTFSGITFRGCRNDGIVWNGNHITLDGCTVKNLSGNAIVINGSENTVHNCEIVGTGKGGVVLTGGDSRTLKPGRNVVENCTIHDWAVCQKTYQPAVTLKGVGNICRGNTMYNTAHEAITWEGNNHLIEKNNIHDVCKESGDAAAIYAGAHWNWYGNIVRYNTVSDITYCSDKDTAHGIYLDDSLSGTTVYGNTVRNVSGHGLMLGGGRDLDVRNNQLNTVATANSSSIPRCGIFYDQRAFDGWKGTSSFFKSSRPDGALWNYLAASDKNTAAWQKRFPQMKSFVYYDPDTNTADEDDPDFIPNPANSMIIGNTVTNCGGSKYNIYDRAGQYSIVSETPVATKGGWKITSSGVESDCQYKSEVFDLVKAGHTYTFKVKYYIEKGSFYTFANLNGEEQWSGSCYRDITAVGTKGTLEYTFTAKADKDFISVRNRSTDDMYNLWQFELYENGELISTAPNLKTVYNNGHSVISPMTSDEFVKISGNPVVTTGYGFTVHETTDAEGHRYHNETVAPTCTTDGYTRHTCVDCGKTYTDNIIPCSGHPYSYKMIAPTCTQNGGLSATCPVCGKTERLTGVTEINYSAYNNYTETKDCFPTYFLGVVSGLTKNDTVKIGFDFYHPGYDSGSEHLRIGTNMGANGYFITDGTTDGNTIRGTSGHFGATWSNTQGIGSIYPGIQQDVYYSQTHYKSDEIYIWNLTVTVNGIPRSLDYNSTCTNHNNDGWMTSATAWPTVGHTYKTVPASINGTTVSRVNECVYCGATTAATTQDLSSAIKSTLKIGYHTKADNSGARLITFADGLFLNGADIVLHITCGGVTTDYPVNAFYTSLSQSDGTVYAKAYGYDYFAVLNLPDSMIGRSLTVNASITTDGKTYTGTNYIFTLN